MLSFLWAARDNQLRGFRLAKSKVWMDVISGSNWVKGWNLWTKI